MAGYPILPVAVAGAGRGLGAREGFLTNGWD